MYSCIKNGFSFRSISRYKAIVLFLAIAIGISFSSSALAERSCEELIRFRRFFTETACHLETMNQIQGLYRAPPSFDNDRMYF